jgi:acyl carrier protein
MNINNAIISFLANEFHLDPESINEETSFDVDFGLNADQVTELLQNLQDSLNIILPEDRVADINTVGQILESLEAEDDEDLT